jgi:uncharacterized OB-fold protein
MQMHILGFKCRKCGHVHYPFRWRCRKCLCVDFDTVPLPDTGTLVTYTTVHALPGDFEVPRLTLGIVQLDNGNRITGQVRIDNPSMGMKVRGEIEVVRKSGYQRHLGVVFYQA